MNNLYQTDKREIGMLPFDPIVLVLDVAKRWALILLLTVATVVGMFIYSDLTYKPVYQTSTTFVVYARGSSTSVYNNLSMTTNVATVFSDLLNSSLLRKHIQEDLDTGYFDGTITASAVAETNLLNVRVTASDPRTAFVVANAIIDHHEELTYKIVDGVSLEVLMHPTVPTAPSNPIALKGRIQKAALAVLVVTVCGFAYLSFAQDKVRSNVEARKKLDCDYLGEINHETKYRWFSNWLKRKKTSILITNSVTSFRFVETVRKLRRRVEHRMRDDKVLMVTSLLENEGKSTVAVNLALSMAQKKARVLLIDCDLRKPACHHLLEYRKFDHNVTDILSGNTEPEDAVKTMKNSSLHLLLQRTRHGRSGELIASEQMNQLISWAREHYDFVVLDLPPLGEVADAESMTRYADACLLVVRQNTAPAAAINKATDALSKRRCKLLGCVLNDVRTTSAFSGQGSGHGYGYGRYHKYGYEKYGRNDQYGYGKEKSSRRATK